MRHIIPMSHLPKSVRGLVSPLVVLLIVAFVVVGVVRLYDEQDQPWVDTSQAYNAAAAAGAFPVASPSPLPQGWRALTSDFQQESDDPVLRVALRAPDGGAVQLIQSAQAAESLLSEELGGSAVSQGTVDVGSRAWERYLGEGGMRALVLIDVDRTIIVVGTAGDKDLRGLAESLSV